MTTHRTKQECKDALEIWAEQAGFKLLYEYKGAKYPVKVVCSLGHEAYPRPADIFSGKSKGCDRCGKKALAQSRYAYVQERFITWANINGYTITGEYIGSHNPIDVICPKGHVSSPRPDNILNNNQGGCKHCDQMFDRLYLVCLDNTWAKVGLATNINRVNFHVSQGWSVYRQWVDLNTRVAILAETSIKSKIKDFPKIEKHRMPRAGHTETFPIDYLLEIENMIEEKLGAS